MSRPSSVPPLNNPEVSAMMASEGIARQTAYARLARERAKSIDTSDVPPGQRMTVMAALLADETSRRNVNELDRVLRERGALITPHDIAKTLWALQKQSWVTFRERGHGLIAIRIRPEGESGYAEAVARNGHTKQPSIRDMIPLVDAAFEPVEVVVLPDDVTPDEFDVIKEALTPDPEPAPTFPLIADLVARSARAARLDEAARLLEEAGETEMAIAAMDKAALSPLEREVIAYVALVQTTTSGA